MISGNIISQIFGLSSTKRKFLSFLISSLLPLFAFSSSPRAKILRMDWLPGIPLMAMPPICRAMETMERSTGPLCLPTGMGKQVGRIVLMVKMILSI